MMDRLKRKLPLKQHFLYEILEYELKKHEWTESPKNLIQKTKLKELILDAFREGLDPTRLFYKFCPVEGIDISEYGITKTWEETLEEIADEAYVPTLH